MSTKELTDEQLEAIVSQKRKIIAPVEAEKKKSSHVAKFIKDFQIQEGYMKIPNHTIWYFYIQVWQQSGRKLTKIGFLREFAAFFPQKRSGNLRYYKLDIAMNKGDFDIAKKYEERTKKKTQSPIKG